MSKKITVNRKAYFEYEILEKFTAGIILQGSEVKSIRANKVSINEAYCYIKDGEAFIKNMHISEYSKIGKFTNHDPIRDRKLLLNKKEISKLYGEIKQKGLTIIPLSIIFNDYGLIKLEIGLAKGKKLFDKRESARLKSINKQLKQLKTN